MSHRESATLTPASSEFFEIKTSNTMHDVRSLEHLDEQLSKRILSRLSEISQLISEVKCSSEGEMYTVTNGDIMPVFDSPDSWASEEHSIIIINDAIFDLPVNQRMSLSINSKMKLRHHSGIGIQLEHSSVD